MPTWSSTEANSHVGPLPNETLALVDGIRTKSSLTCVEIRRPRPCRRTFDDAARDADARRARRRRAAFVARFVEGRERRHRGPRGRSLLPRRLAAERRGGRHVCAPGRAWWFIEGVDERVLVSRTPRPVRPRDRRGPLDQRGRVGVPTGGCRAPRSALLPDVELRRTKYDLDEAVRRCRRTDGPRAEEMVELLLSPPTADGDRRTCRGCEFFG